LILYGLLAGVSVGRLFLAGILPALLVAAGLMIAVRIIAGRRGYGTVRDKRLPWRAVRVRFRAAWLALLMPVGIIVGLRVGVFTPTELGALVAIYALLVGMFAYKEIRWRDLPSLLKEAALISASILLIIAAAGALGYVLTAERVPARLAEVVTSSFQNPLAILVVINVLVLVLGLFMESTSLLVIITPVLAPVAIELGIDPVHFGVLLVFNLVIGGLTPPVGGNMYTVCAVTGCSVDTFSREVLPFLGVLVAVLALITVAPIITLLLPSLLMG
jgi:tripartite ATP-independent transporter DctM subunit